MTNERHWSFVMAIWASAKVQTPSTEILHHSFLGLNEECNVERFVTVCCVTGIRSPRRSIVVIVLLLLLLWLAGLAIGLARRALS